jgi:hypothetical protein
MQMMVAGYGNRAIMDMVESRLGRTIAESGLSRYRHNAKVEIAKRERYSAAMTTGLALREERIERLKRHAEELEPRRFEQDKRGGYPLEPAYRLTLRQIAEEVGDLKPGVVAASELAVTFRPGREQEIKQVQTIEVTSVDNREDAGDNDNMVSATEAG